jgi:hypothetical protein
MVTLELSLNQGLGEQYTFVYGQDANPSAPTLKPTNRINRMRQPNRIPYPIHEFDLKRWKQLKNLILK